MYHMIDENSQAGLQSQSAPVITQTGRISRTAEKTLQKKTLCSKLYDDLWK